VTYHSAPQSTRRACHTFSIGTMTYDSTASSLTGNTDPAILDELLSIRSSIDNIDATLVYLLAERFKCTQKVGQLKARHSLPPSDPEREKAHITRLHELSRDADLAPAVAVKSLTLGIDEVIRHHTANSQEHGCPPRSGWSMGHVPAAARTRSMPCSSTSWARPRSRHWLDCPTSRPTPPVL